MQIFKIVHKGCGWAIEFGAAAITPCLSRATAIAQAEQMAEAMRRHGEVVSIVFETGAAIDTDEPVYFAPSAKAAAAARIRTPRRIQRDR